MPSRARRALILGALVFVSAPQALPDEGKLRLIGTHPWAEDHPDFGGVSALDLAEDGLSFTALTDRGQIVTGRFVRDAAGAVTGAENVALAPLLSDGIVALGPDWGDSEGLAGGEDGTLHVSFEGEHRVWSFAAPGAAPERLPRHADFAGFPTNSGLEALAIDGAGRLYTIPERSGALGRPFPVYRWDGRGWSIAAELPREGEFLPVAADFGPDGRLYVLERAFLGLFGFRSRISRYAFGEGAGPRELLLETASARHGNLESLAVWADAKGRIRLTLVSDDNFLPLIGTEIADYAIAE
jgi:hypothetical protein